MTDQLTPGLISKQILEVYGDLEKYQTDNDNRPIEQLDTNISKIVEGLSASPTFLYIPYTAAQLTEIPAFRVVEIDLIAAEIASLASDSSKIIGYTVKTAEIRNDGSTDRFFQVVAVLGSNVIAGDIVGVPTSPKERLHFKVSGVDQGKLAIATEADISSEAVAIVVDETSAIVSFTGVLTNIFTSVTPSAATPLPDASGNSGSATEYSRGDHEHPFAAANDLVTHLNTATIPLGGPVDPASHNHDDVYYTETELDAGQLDNQYRTETELASVSTGEGAAFIGSEDAGGYYSSGTVEGILQEVGASIVGTSGNLSLVGFDEVVGLVSTTASFTLVGDFALDAKFSGGSLIVNYEGLATISSGGEHSKFVVQVEFFRATILQTTILKEAQIKLRPEQDDFDTTLAYMKPFAIPALAPEIDQVKVSVRNNRIVGSMVISNPEVIVFASPQV